MRRGLRKMSEANTRTFWPWRRRTVLQTAPPPTTPTDMMVAATRLPVTLAQRGQSVSSEHRVRVQCCRRRTAAQTVHGADGAHSLRGSPYM